MKKGIKLMIIVFFTIITTLIFTVGTMPTAATEVEDHSTKWPVLAEAMLNDYYDLNNDDQINVCDLAIVKRASLIGDQFSIRDYELVRAKILTGEWIYDLEVKDIDVDELIYCPETIEIINTFSHGILVDMRVIENTVTIRFLNDVTVYEMRIASRSDFDLARPILWAFNHGEMHISLELNEDEHLVWEQWEYEVFPEISQNQRIWPTSTDVMTRYYDFDHDDKLTVFDLCIAKREVLTSDKLSLNDVKYLQQYIHTGKWINPITFSESDLDDLEYCQETLDQITFWTYGMLVDMYIEGDTLRIRFLNDANIKEIKLGRYDQIVLKLMDFHYNEECISLGVTADNKLAWNWHSEDLIPEIIY